MDQYSILFFLLPVELSSLYAVCYSCPESDKNKGGEERISLCDTGILNRIWTDANPLDFLLDFDWFQSYFTK